MNNTANATKYKEISKDEQLLNLIRKFYYKYEVYKHFSSLKRTSEEILDEFVSAAYALCLERKVIDRFNDKKGSFSTYVYFVLRQNYVILIYQIKYNIDIENAKSFQYLYEQNPEDYNRKTNIYQPVYAEDYNTFEEDDSNENSNVGFDIWDVKVANEYNSQLVNTTEKQIEDREKISNILQIIKRSKKFSKQNKQLLLYHIENYCDAKKTTKKFNCTRQNVSRLMIILRKLLKQHGISLNS